MMREKMVWFCGEDDEEEEEEEEENESCEWKHAHARTHAHTPNPRTCTEQMLKFSTITALRMDSANCVDNMK